MPRGRLRVLDELKQREVCALVSAGCSLLAAANYVECAPNTIRREAVRNPDFGERFRAGRMNSLALVYNSAGIGTTRRNVAMTRQYLQAYSQRLATLRLQLRGVDPEIVSPIMVEDLDTASPAARALGARAIGECGLDSGKAKRGGADIATQTRVLEAQLEVARQLRLPVILHCVGAHALLLDVLGRQGELPAGGVLHSYSGSRELIRDYLRFGLCFSFAGIVTRAFAMSFDPFETKHEAQAALGDSGGAVFIRREGRFELAGVLIAVGGYPGQPPETSLYGNTTNAADLSVFARKLTELVRGR